MTGRIKEAAYDLLALHIYLNLYFITSLPDGVLADLCRCIARGLEPFDPPPRILLALKDLETIFRGGPPGSAALKNILHKARFPQAMAGIRGMLVHYTFNRQPYK